MLSLSHTFIFIIQSLYLNLGFLKFCKAVVKLLKIWLVYFISSQYVVAHFSPSSIYLSANLLSLFLTPPTYPWRCSLLSTSPRNDSTQGSVHPRPAPGLLLLRQGLKWSNTKLCENLPEYWALSVDWSKGTLLLVVIDWVHGGFVLIT